MQNGTSSSFHHQWGKAHKDQALAEEFESECLWWCVESVTFFNVVAISKLPHVLVNNPLSNFVQANLIKLSGLRKAKNHENRKTSWPKFSRRRRGLRKANGVILTTISMIVKQIYKN